jgi:elongator complex protein 4
LDDSGVGAARATTTARTTKKRNLRAPDVCQTYDWTREEDEATLRDADVSFERFGGDEGDGEGETDAWARCFEFVETFVRGLRDEEVGRVLVQPETPRDEGEWAACARLARALKGLVRETNVACVMILPLALAPARWGAMIRHVADCAIDVQPLEGPTSEIESLLPEPHLCVGLVAVRKLQFQGGVVSPLTRMDRVYALQMRRKRMAIKPLQIRPEEERKKSGGESACGAVEGVGLDDF